jgi:hypothetical protein
MVVAYNMNITPNDVTSAIAYASRAQRTEILLALYSNYISSIPEQHRHLVDQTKGVSNNELLSQWKSFDKYLPKHAHEQIEDLTGLWEMADS